MQHYNDRFKDAPWYIKSQEEKILVIGVGGIGSNAMLALTKTIPANYAIIDPDVVEEMNIGTQMFTIGQVGKYKVEAIKELILWLVDKPKILVFNYTYNKEFYPITITCLDNMRTRKEVFEKWKKYENRELFIDGRLRANLYEVYTVTKGKEEEYEKTLFDDSEASDGPCTFKQTAYFAMLIGARITHILVNYLTNKYKGEDMCNVPFKVTEFGEPFYFEAV